MLPDRFWAKVRKTDSCWLWTGTTAKGYGQPLTMGEVQRLIDEAQQ